MNARQFLLKTENKLLHTNDKRYTAWFLRNRVTEEALRAQREAHFPYEPLISILVPVYRRATGNSGSSWPMLHRRNRNCPRRFPDMRSGTDGSRSSR